MGRVGRQRTFMLALWLLAFLVAVPAVQANIPQELIDAACAEGALVIYSGAGLDRTLQFAEMFSEVFPCIRTEVVRQASHQLHTRFLTEQRAGQYLADIIMHGNPGIFIQELVEGGFIAEYDHGHDEFYPDSLKVRNYAYPIFVYYIGPAYNPFLVTPQEAALLDSWEGITSPVWRGRMGLSVPSAGGTSYSAPYIFLRARRDEYGPEFMARVAANNPLFFTSQIPAHQMVVSGEIHLHPWGTSSTTGDLLQQGAPIAMKFPAPTPAVPTIAGMAKNAPHPNAARLFMRWAFSEEGQRASMDAFNTPVAYETLSHLPPPGYERMPGGWQPPRELLEIDWEDFDASLDAVVSEWNRIFGYLESR